MNRYDKGFGPPAPAGAAPAKRPPPTRHGAAVPAHHQEPCAERAEGDGSRLADPKPRCRSWRIYANQVSLVFLFIGAAGGTASMIASGNWAAMLVLPLLLWFTSWIALTLLAMVADFIRGV